MRKQCESCTNITFPQAEQIESLEGANGELTKIIFKSGPDLPRAGLFFSTGCHQASDLAKRLGCKHNPKGGVETSPDTEETSVPGVYVAGDVSRDVLLVAVAIAEGAQAAVAINKAFLRRDGFLRLGEKRLALLPSRLLDTSARRDGIDESRMTFWITRNALLSAQPSTIQAIQATMKITKPRTVTRAFRLPRPWPQPEQLSRPQSSQHDQDVHAFPN